MKLRYMVLSSRTGVMRSIPNVAKDLKYLYIYSIFSVVVQESRVMAFLQSVQQCRLGTSYLLRKKLPDCSKKVLE